MNVIVVGAGVGGLTSAALLHQRGHDVQVIEQATAIGDDGGGMQIVPNAGRVLAQLGLADALADVGTIPGHVVLRRWEDDSTLLMRPVGSASADRHGMPYYNVHRPDLVGLLLRCLADVPIRLGTTVRAVGDEQSTAVVDLGDGTRHKADVVIGADGIDSRVSESLFGHQPTQATGMTIYRSLARRCTSPMSPTDVTIRLGPDAHLLSYAMGVDSRFINLDCIVHEPGTPADSGIEPGELDALRAHFAGWSAQTQALLDTIDAPILKQTFRDRMPLDRWTAGPVALLGDACHPMMPSSAQGTCQAIEDAAILDRCLALPGADVAQALQRYEATRRPRAIGLRSRSFIAAERDHLPDGAEQRTRDRLYAELNDRVRRGLGLIDPLVEYDPLTAELTEPRPTVRTEI